MRGREGNITVVSISVSQSKYIPPWVVTVKWELTTSWLVIIKISPQIKAFSNYSILTLTDPIPVIAGKSVDQSVYFPWIRKNCHNYKGEMLLSKKTNKFCATHYYGICWGRINISVGSQPPQLIGIFGKYWL